MRAVREQIAELQLAEARKRQVEAAELQFAEFEAEEFAIPTRVQRQLVVGEAVSLDLRLRPIPALPSSARRQCPADAPLASPVPGNQRALRRGLI